MKTSKNFTNEKVIELSNIRRRQKQRKTAKLLAALRKIWRFLLSVFTKKNELQVRLQSDRFGYTWWTVYDSATSRTAKFLSQAEMLAWIKDYYSQ